MNILITGGAGFIGSQVVRLFVEKYPEDLILNLDALTYAANPENNADVAGKANYRFLKGNICDDDFLAKVFATEKPDAVIHLAAETHVDRSISGPAVFAQTNIIGTLNLLEAARKSWQNDLQNRRFLHISTDEVYGSLGATGAFYETSPYQPHSPYAASKAASDHLVRSYHDTYGMNCVISNCSNNFGPNQYPEKLIPLAIHNLKAGLPVPVYGDGSNVRDWLFVGDHAAAIDVIFRQGRAGETYLIGGSNECTNIDLLRVLAKIVDKKLGREIGFGEKLLTFITDRKGHDKRYAIDATKLKTELGWQPQANFTTALEQTVDWYLANESWLKVSMGEAFGNCYKKQYKGGE